MEDSAIVGRNPRAVPPLVSVIVPVFNGERFLAPALQSVFNQDYRQLEVLVVDDGSTDTSAAIARTFPEAQYIFQSNQGAAAARNTGVQAATGAFIAFLDADDLWLPTKLSSQMAYHAEHPEVDCSFIGLANFVEDGVEPPQWLRDNQSLSGRPDYSPCTLLAKRSVFDQVGLFDTSYHVGEDTEWFARFADAGLKVGFIPEILVRRRIHGANLSYESPVVRLSVLMKILKASIDRKRQVMREDQK